MVPFQLETRARGRSTFQDTPSEPLDANRRNHAEAAASPRAVPIGAFDTAADVGTNALGRCRAAVGRWKFVACAQGGAFPSRGGDRPGFVVTHPVEGRLPTRQVARTGRSIRADCAMPCSTCGASGHNCRTCPHMPPTPMSNLLRAAEKKEWDKLYVRRPLVVVCYLQRIASRSYGCYS